MKKRQKLIFTKRSSALKFDGSQNYVTLGTLGNLGSNLGNGFYCSFIVKTTSVSQGIFGISVTSVPICQIGLNTSTDFSGTLNHGIAFYLLSRTGNLVLAGGIATPTINFNDGSSHTVTITANPATNVITITIDNAAQTVTYALQQTPAVFTNFTTGGFDIAARNLNGSPNAYFACTIDNLKIGTSAGSLFGSYLFNEGMGTTTADSSGNGNTGTLIKGAGSYPSWVPGL